MRNGLSWLCLLLVFAARANATIFGNLRGIVHDPQHRPISDAEVAIRATGSAWSQISQTDDNGGFEFTAVPLGEYSVTITAKGFEEATQKVIVNSGGAPILHFQLRLGKTTQRVEITGSPAVVNTESSTTETVISQQEIARTPGADRTNSLAMITNYVPGAYYTHDQLHVRGGHQVTWLVDGVPIVNTNIASNVGPQFDPKDVDYLEAQRGSYDAEYGDRAFAVFNVVPRTGFERNNEGELVTSFGNFYQTNDQLSFGSHTERFAYYASLNGNRTDLGLQTPTSAVIHDRANGFGGFGTLVYNIDPNDQLRLVTSLRKDFYQIPNSPDDQAAGVRDIQRESDAFVNFSWVHTFGPGLLLTLSPFYHFNRANFIGGPNDPQFSIQQNRSSNYEGAQATFGAVVKKHNARFGVYGFAQQDNENIALQATDGSGTSLNQTEGPTGNVEALFAEDSFRATPWLTLNGGARLTHFGSTISENSADPRVGMAIRIPRVGWVLRGFYGRYYEAPPLSTVSGPLFQFVLQQGLGFVPLHGQRDEEFQFGLNVPLRGWTLDVDYFHNKVRNFFDHNNVGNSNIFFPLTVEGARIRGAEATLRSPRFLFGRAQVHAAFSHQFAEGRGEVNGGLINFAPPSGYFYLDHDQRNTLNTGFDLNLPWQTWANGNIYYGSGFTDSGGPAHLPGHTTADLSLGRSLGENISVSITALNLANRRFLLDNSLTFGGTHFFDPREIFVQVRYRFHY
jgi:outer membrane receptor protein involved in Fe transport